MKILFLCHCLTGGGAERVAVSLANGLIVRGNEVIMLTDLHKVITYEINSKVRLLQVNNGVSSPFRKRLQVYLQIRKILKKEKPSVIISIMPFYAVEARIATWTSYWCPIIMTEHNSFERPCDAPFKLRQKLEKFYFNYMYDHITVLTKADFDCLNGRFRNISVMPNPLFLTPLANVPKKQKVILAVGRLDVWKVKGFDLLIMAWKEIADQYEDWILKIVGEGSNENLNILKEIGSGCQKIIFEPYTNDITLEYRKAEIFVLSSRYEGFGLVLTEAMSQGCACIACDYKGRQTEIIENGKSGLVCRVDDTEDLKSKIITLIENLSLRTVLQQNALRAVIRFSEDNILSRWVDLLGIVVDKKK